MKNQSEISENKENYRGGKMVQRKDCWDGQQNGRFKIFRIYIQAVTFFQKEMGRLKPLFLIPIVYIVIYGVFMVLI